MGCSRRLPCPLHGLCQLEPIRQTVSQRLQIRASLVRTFRIDLRRRHASVALVLLGIVEMTEARQHTAQDTKSPLTHSQDLRQVGNGPGLGREDVNSSNSNATRVARGTRYSATESGTSSYLRSGEQAFHWRPPVLPAHLLSCRKLLSAPSYSVDHLRHISQTDRLRKSHGHILLVHVSTLFEPFS